MISNFKFQISNRKSARGFTLIEVLVTMVLMTIVLPVAMRGMSIAMAAASTARHKSEAASLAQAKLSEIIEEVLTSDTSNENASGDFNALGTDYAGYSWQCQSADDTNIGVTELTLSINWSERGQQKAMTFSTLVTTPP